ncbi:MAG: hypothetical protein IJM54_08920 [Thermoguttaceae bacterium]|nr:hypothetical protein [Thermoguttaceae bacterium]
MKARPHANEHWGSRLGVVLAVSGSAVGLGNFIRFPGQATLHGGGAFMIPYLVSLLIVAIPLASAEWALGRYGGKRGYHSPMGIYYAAGARKPICGICGGFMLFIAYVIDMYYLVVEGWCLVYALQYLGGLLKPLGLGFSVFPTIGPGLNLGSSEKYGSAFESITGLAGNGSLFSSSTAAVLAILALCAFVNFRLIYRGVSKGIERFCKWVAPLILLCSFLIVARVLTLGNPSGEPGQSLLDGLGFMWNPRNLDKTLLDMDVWLAATSQIFFSTSICTSAVCTYTSYVKSKQDIALSSVTATMANEFCEVALGGLMIIPPAIMFLGASVADKIESSFSLGFVVLPNVFGEMPMGQFFGFLFFSLLFFAAITSSISQLQPAVAFLKESFRWSHKTSVLVAAALVCLGSAYVCWFTARFAALDTFDFWAANFAPFLFAIVQTIIISYVWGLKNLKAELDRGAIVKLSPKLGVLIKYVSLPYLVLIFGIWMFQNFGARIETLKTDKSAQLSTIFLAAIVFVLFAVSYSTVRRWKREEKESASLSKESRE